MIPWAAPAYWGNEERYVADALRSTWISGGPFVERLEREVRALLGGETSGRETLATSNGTTALQLPCIALGLGPVPAFDVTASCSGFLYALELAARAVATDRKSVV